MAKKMYGAVIVFDEGTTSDEAEAALAKVEHRTSDHWRTRVVEFDPEWGSPVWYVP